VSTSTFTATHRTEILDSYGWRAGSSYNDGNGQDTAIFAAGYGTDIIVVTSGTVSSNDAGISVRNSGSGKTTVSSTGDVNALGLHGIHIANYASATDIDITAKDVSGVTNGIHATNLGSGTTEISVNGNIVATGVDSDNVAGSMGVNGVGGFEGIRTEGSEATINILASASVSGGNEGIKTDSKADTVTVNGSITGLNGTAISLLGGNDTINLGTTATITGIIDGGTGIDTAYFSVGKSAVDTFIYDEQNKTAVVTISGKATSFVDFESFKFTDDLSGMTAEEAVNIFAGLADTSSQIAAATDII